jgi:20S proteasome subunit beta 3
MATIYYLSTTRPDQSSQVYPVVQSVARPSTVTNKPCASLFTMSILEYNGAAMIAMAGKNCVGIASDRRLGSQAQTVAMDFQKVFAMQDKLYVGLAGLATDVQTLRNLLQFRLNLYKLREERDMSPQVFSHLLSTLLYEKRFGPYYVEPIIAGLDDKNEPFLSGMDLIGATVLAKDFVVSGTCTGNLYGMCETLYKKDQEPDQLLETLSQALMASVDRDALSGWGGVVHIITEDGVSTHILKARMD